MGCWSLLIFTCIYGNGSEKVKNLVANFSEMDLNDFLRGIANNMSYGLKAKQPLDSDDENQ